MKYFLTVCLNPVLQKTIVLPCLKENEVNRSSEYYLDAAGKGVIVSRVLLQLKNHTLHLTQLGGRNRNLFLEMLKQEGIPVKWVNSGSEIRFCYSLLNKEKHTSTEIVEEAVPVASDTEDKICTVFNSLLPDSLSVIISGTKAPGFSQSLYPRLVKKAKQEGKMTILDYRGDDLKESIILGPEVIKPNYSEFVATFFPKDRTPDENNIKEKMIQLWKDYGITTILTNGHNDVLYVEDGNVKNVTPDPVIPVNTIGCGDAFTAGFTHMYFRSRYVTEGVNFGLECARRNALTLKPGQLY
ncbi:MAG: tagatose-6-phosphate kinase [Spirochaetales bacterium]|nr:tagatose-6-phosphate kinase [Spirochaetales bacterium]